MVRTAVSATLGYARLASSSRALTNRILCRIIAVMLLLTFGDAVHAEPITVEKITVVDGDTIDARGARFRMIGYDTPEVSTPLRKVGAAERALALRENMCFLFPVFGLTACGAASGPDRQIEANVIGWRRQ